MINYEMYEDEFDNLSNKEKIQSPSKPVGSLTDNLRMVKPRRDGAHKRVHLLWDER